MTPKERLIKLLTETNLGVILVMIGVCQLTYWVICMMEKYI